VLTVPDGGDRFSANTQDDQGRVGLRVLDEAALVDGALRLTLPALAWSVVELEVAKA
jgi:alpha-N-arabinofuranosidase